MSMAFDLMKNVSPGKQTWRLTVRVERLWEMFPLDEPTKPFSIEMVLIDAEGCKIQASIRKPMMKKFKELVAEGEVYKMFFFGVVGNLGSYRATGHEYRLLFHAMTKLTRCETANIPYLGVVPNVLNTTRILWNPEIALVVDFKNSIISKGIDIEGPIGLIEEHVGSASADEEFLHMFPRKIISELHATEEDGYFIVLATIVAVLNDTQWWYKLKVEVFDGEDTAAFVMFDSDAELLTAIPCSAMMLDMIISYCSWTSWGGRELLFKVEKGDDYAFKYDDTFKVKRKKFVVPLPSLDDIAEEDGICNRSAHDSDVVDVATEAPFSVDDYLSDQAGFPIISGGAAGDEAGGSGVVKVGTSGKGVDAQPK
ncbi:Nucleic acid-binding, OB-fold [Sesbania bispinosa]|nr:Nucleic acid-binding, OB-fold [Sesbania bispinosa]